MLERIFLTVWDMSVRGGYSILVVLLARTALRRWCDRKYVYGLWLVAFLNLCMPFSVQGVFSLFPLRLMELSAIKNGQMADNVSVAGAEQMADMPSFAPDQQAGNTGESREMPEMTSLSQIKAGKASAMAGAAGAVWAAGVSGLMLYNLAAVFRMQKRLRMAGRGRADIRELDGIESPFLWGVAHPVICIPAGMEEAERVYLAAHEQCHRQRRDHIIKPAVYIITVLHWFNPIVWLAYRMCIRDMEISCDELVLSNAAVQGEDIRKQYAESLLKFAIRQNGYAMTPLAFGEPSVKERIKNVLQYHKKGTAVTGLALVCVIFLAAGLIFKPKGQEHQADPGQTVPEAEKAEALFLYGYTGYLDAYTQYGGYENYADCDYDQDGLTDRIYREETEKDGNSYDSIVNYRIEFGDGKRIALDDYLEENLQVQAADLNGDGTPEIIIQSAYGSSTDPDAYGAAAVFEQKGSGYESVPLPFADSNECGGGAENVSPCIRLHYEVAGSHVRVTSGKPQIEEDILLDEDIRSDLSMYGYAEEDGSVERATYPYDVRLVSLQDGSAGLEFYFELFAKWSGYRLAVRTGYDKGELRVRSYEVIPG